MTLKPQHLCKEARSFLTEKGYGTSEFIDDIMPVYDNGTWTFGEMYSGLPVKYCPYCGVELGDPTSP